VDICFYMFLCLVGHAELSIRGKKKRKSSVAGLFFQAGRQLEKKKGCRTVYSPPLAVIRIGRRKKGGKGERGRFAFVESLCLLSTS